jgi:hypothetical protein
MNIFENVKRIFEPKKSILSSHVNTNTIEHTLSKKVIRQVAAHMKPYGYTLNKPAFLCREEPLLIKFFHFHNYRSGLCFRISFGVRVLNDDCKVPSLNGPVFVFSQAEYKANQTDAEQCVAEMTALLVSEGVPWHNSWSDVNVLLSENDTALSQLKRNPLSGAERLWLLEARDGQSSAENVTRSRLLLGKKPAKIAP